MSDSDKWSSGGMDSKIEISTDVGVFSVDYIQLIFFGKRFNVFIGRGSSDDDIAFFGLI